MRPTKLILAFAAALSFSFFQSLPCSAAEQPQYGVSIEHPREGDIFLFRSMEISLKLTKLDAGAVSTDAAASATITAPTTTVTEVAQAETTIPYYKVKDLGLEACVTVSSAFNRTSGCTALTDPVINFHVSEEVLPSQAVIGNTHSGPSSLEVQIDLYFQGALVGACRRGIFINPYEKSAFSHLTPRDLASSASPLSDAPPAATGAIAERLAYFTLLTNDDYLPGVIALQNSLRKVNSKYSLHVMVPSAAADAPRHASEAHVESQKCDAPPLVPGISPGAQDRLKSTGAKIWTVSTDQASKLPIGSMAPQLNRTQWLKLQLWNMTDFSRLVYLDADTVITANVDELLESPVINKFACVGDYFAGSVFVVVPSKDTFERLSERSYAGGGKYLYGEQDFLNDFFRTDSDTGLETRLVGTFLFSC